MRDGSISEDNAYQALNHSNKEKTPLPYTLVTLGFISAQNCYAASDEFGTPAIDIESLSPTRVDKEFGGRQTHS